MVIHHIFVADSDKASLVLSDGMALNLKRVKV